MQKHFIAVCAITSLLRIASAQILFQDDFESGNLSKWTVTGTSPFTIDTPENAVPIGGIYSALLDNSRDRMHRNIIGDAGGGELGAYFIFTAYWYDESGGATRFFNEVRGYNGGTGLPNGGSTASGTIAQIFAIGKNDSVSLAGEVFDATKYQARVAYGSAAGWFNLDGPGSANRSVGWHKFSIERLANGTTVNFYVDDILSRTISGADPVSMDTMVLGPGTGTTAGNAWLDGISLAVIPEPSAVALGLLALAMWLRNRGCR